MPERRPLPIPPLLVPVLVAVWTCNLPMLVALGALAGVLPPRPPAPVDEDGRP